MSHYELIIWQWHDEDPDAEELLWVGPEPSGNLEQWADEDERGGGPGWYWRDEDVAWWMGPEPSWNVEQYWREAEALGGLCAMRYFNA